MVAAYTWHSEEGGIMSEKLKKTDEEWRQELSPEQYQILRQKGTERAFTGQYWNNHEAGIYVDVVSGQPLFSSTDKYESGTGWPSFTRPIESAAVTEKVDGKLWMKRTEVRSSGADSHLGHVFDDGPRDAGGLRYCMNSAALRFIPVAELEAQGLAQLQDGVLGRRVGPQARCCHPGRCRRRVHDVSLVLLDQHGHERSDPVHHSPQVGAELPAPLVER